MKQGKTLTELAVELERQQESKIDYQADTRCMELRRENAESKVIIKKSGGTETELGLTTHAGRQIATSYRIPAKYWDLMRDEAPELLAGNVNHWFHAKPQQRMVRTLDGSMRAFLSSRYRPLDNFDLAQTVLPIFQSIAANVVSCEVTPDRMYIKVLTDRVKGEIVKGDAVQGGMVISNSEVGAGSLRIEPLVYRLVCSNGMIAADHSMRKYHVGRGGGDENGASEFFRDSTRQADDRAFWMKVADTVRGSVSQVGFDKILVGMRKTVECKIVEPVKTVEVVSQRLGLNESEQGGVLRHLIEGHDLSAYGLLNAVTRQSQDVDDYDRATELERMGGQVIELAHKDWGSIVKQAC
jgi:hypothetical protein